VRELDTGKESLAMPTSGGVKSLALSSDGRRLFTASDAADPTITVWDLEAGKQTLALRGHSMQVAGLALSSDGKRLFSASEDQTIRVWDVEAGKELVTLFGHGGPVLGLALSGDGKRLFTGSGDGTVLV